MSVKLTSQEIEILKILRKKNKQVTLKELKEKFDEIQVMRTCSWLEEKGLVKIEKIIEEKHILTEKGREALKILPERKLINRLRNNKIKIDELDEEEKIGLSQSMKSKLIEIKNGFLELSEKGKLYLDKELPEEKCLKNIEECKDENIKKNLIKRGLIKKERKISFIYSLTEFGKRAEIEEMKGVTKLNQEIVLNWRNYSFKEYDVEKPVKKIYPGKRHPYLNFLSDVRKKLIAMGFKEIKSPIIELEFWNFDALFQPQDHPAREIHDKFEIENPEYGFFTENIEKYVKNVREIHEKRWNYKWDERKALKLMLRSHNTAASARALAFEKHPKVFTINRVFRPDVIDKKHFIEFYQLEGIVRGKDLNLKHLLGYLELFGKEIAQAEEVKFKPSYFPFTEPSLELFIKHPKLGWIEVGGAGIFRPEVVEPFGIKEKVLAWGLGIDRLAMAKFNIDDIRELIFPQNLNYLRKVL